MLGDLKTDVFECYHRTYPAWYLWVFIDGKFVRELTEYRDVFWRRGAPVQILCNHGSTKQLTKQYQFCICYHYQVGLGLGLV